MAGTSANRRQFQSIFGDVIAHKATVDVANLVDAAGATQVVTVTGAALGDFVLVAPLLDAQDITVTAYVQAANLVEIRFQNEGAATVNLASQTINILVLKPGRLFDDIAAT